MLRIKLQRVGRKHDPSYRLVVTDKKTGPKSNKHVETVGHYDTIRKTKNFKEDRIKYWLSVGAQATDVVHNLFVKAGLIEGKTKNVLPKKSPIKKEGEEQQESEAQSEKSQDGEEKAEETSEKKPEQESKEKKEEA